MEILLKGVSVPSDYVESSLTSYGSGFPVASNWDFLDLLV